MRKIILASIALVAALSACSFNVSGSEKESGSDGTRTVEVADFDRLVVAIPADVVYETGDPKIVIVAREKFIDHIVAEQDGQGRITVKTDGSVIRSLKNTKIYVTSMGLSELTVNGAANVDCKHGIVAARDFALNINGAADVDIAGLTADNVTVQCNGAGDFQIAGLDAYAIEVTINGAADAVLTGRVDSASLTINGAGNINAKKLEAASIRPSIHGVGSIVTK